MKQFHSFVLDTLNECLWHNGEQISLPPKPFAVLRHLVEHAGRLISHDELLETLWPDTYVQPQVLRTYVLELRKVLGDDAGNPRFIRTLPKRGYCFVAEVTESLETSAPLTPARGAEDARSAAIVGRSAELARLASLVDMAAQGRRQVVFVTGEAGIGKTALVEAFCRRVSWPDNSANAGLLMVAARGQCIEGFGGKEEYYPVMEALHQLCDSPAAERARRVLGRVAPEWLNALRLAAQAKQPVTAIADEPSAVAERLPGDLCGALEELSLETPLMLIFEDLHWADDSTIQLISALARRQAPAKLMVLVTCRQQHGSPGPSLDALRQDLSRRRLCTAINLAPLTRAAAGDLLRRELKEADLPAGLDAFVHQHSEGNPLFAISLLEHLIAQRFLLRDADGRWKQRAALEEMEIGVPEGLAQMIELEIECLAPREQRLLEAGSLTSVVFPAWAVAAAMEEDAQEVEEACDDLARRLHFLERCGEDELPGGARSAFYVFVHGLYREVLYRRQSATGRAKKHVRIAERLGALFAGREADVSREMALHYEAAGDWQRAVDALRSAAWQAEQRHSYVQAAELLEQGLRVAENLQEFDREKVSFEMRAELLMARSNAQINAEELTLKA